MFVVMVVTLFLDCEYTVIPAELTLPKVAISWVVPHDHASHGVLTRGYDEICTHHHRSDLATGQCDQYHQDVPVAQEEGVNCARLSKRPRGRQASKVLTTMH